MAQSPTGGDGVNGEDFFLLADEFMVQEKALFLSKRFEYASEGDVLSNFKRASAVLGSSAEAYCMALIIKHIDGICQSVLRDRIEWSWGNASREGTKQRISDARNYLLLLAGLLEERLGGKEKCEGEQ